MWVKGWFTRPHLSLCSMPLRCTVLSRNRLLPWLLSQFWRLRPQQHPSFGQRRGSRQQRRRRRQPGLPLPRAKYLEAAELLPLLRVQSQGGVLGGESRPCGARLLHPPMRLAYTASSGQPHLLPQMPAAGVRSHPTGCMVCGARGRLNASLRNLPCTFSPEYGLLPFSTAKLLYVNPHTYVHTLHITHTHYMHCILSA